MATILVVDDDASLVEAVADVLSAKGYGVATASSGAEGYRKAREAKPDLMLLDVMMSKDNEGFEIAQQMKKDPETRDIPIIIITGIRKAKHLPFGFEPDEDWLPVKAVLEKPVSPDVLLKWVAEVLGS